MIRTANCQTTLCALFGCWLTQLQRILVTLSHHPKISPIRRLTLLPPKQALRSCTYRFGLRPQSRKLQRPVSCDCLPVPVFWNKPTASKPSTTYDVPLYHNRVSVSLAFLCVCAFSVTISVLFTFRFTYARSCILYSFNCTILFLLYTTPFDTLYLLVIAFAF